MSQTQPRLWTKFWPSWDQSYGPDGTQSAALLCCNNPSADQKREKSKETERAIRHLRTEIDPAAEMGHPNALNARDMDTSCEIAPAVTSM